jgi:hypothetical protein
LYEGVFQRHPDVIPIEEEDTMGFDEALLHCIDELLKIVGSDGLICFCVDDLIFIDMVDLRYVVYRSWLSSLSVHLTIKHDAHPSECAPVFFSLQLLCLRVGC